MAEVTKISWADATVNFWIGCAKVSPACAHCYAEAWDSRYHKASSWGVDAPRTLRLAEAIKEGKKLQKKAAAEGSRLRVFTNSLSDFFEDRVDLDEGRVQALDLIRQTPNLDWLILTKRPGAITALLRRAKDLAATSTSQDSPLVVWLKAWLHGAAPTNAFLGTTVEDQERADERIPQLLASPAAVRFLSCEPLLGPVVLREYVRLKAFTKGDFPFHTTFAHEGVHRLYKNPHGAMSVIAQNGKELGVLPSEGIDLGLGVDWIIVGGESGRSPRAMHPDWARSLRDQAEAFGVPFHFKQWGTMEPIGTISGHQKLPFGEYLLPGEPGAPRGGFGFHKVAGKGHRVLDGRTWDGFPQ